MAAEQIEIETYRKKYDGDETRMIDAALAEAGGTGTPVIFGAKAYEYRGHLKFSRHQYNLRGTPGATEIKTTTHWVDFNSEGHTKISGIIFDGAETHPRTHRIRNTKNGVFRFKECGFRGAFQKETGGGLAAGLSIEDETPEVYLTDCTISDVNSAKPSGIKGDRPTCRGLYITAPGAKVYMTGGEISRIGDRVTDRNGISIWNREGRHGGGLGWHDLDGVVVQGRGTSGRELHLNGVTFSDIPKRFIKGNRDTKNIFIENCLFHVKSGRKCNRPVDLQRQYSGAGNYSGHLKNCTFRWDTGDDFPTSSGGTHPGVVILNRNEPSDRFRCAGNHFEISDETVPSGGQCLFGLAGFGGGIHNLSIEGTTTNLPGIPYFIRIIVDAGESAAEAKERGIHRLRISNNRVTGITEAPLVLVKPSGFDCDAGRIYSWYDIDFEENRYPGFAGVDYLQGPACEQRENGNVNQQYIKNFSV